MESKTMLKINSINSQIDKLKKQLQDELNKRYMEVGKIASKYDLHLISDKELNKVFSKINKDINYE
jgi:hypothetical protein